MKISYLKLQLLGSFIVDVTGTEFEKFRTVRSKELLIYLALNKDGASRAFLANFFWPDKDEKKQQVNLRQAIAQLIKPIGEEFFHIDDHSIQLNWDAKIFLDAQEFFDAYEFGKLEAAEKLFSGDLVPDFSMLSDESDKWLSSERVRIRNAALDVLHQLTDRRLGHMDYPAAIESARRQLTLDPLRESATFQLMQACAYSGQREEAIAAFDELEEILADRLAISPKNETFALLRQIESGEIGTPLTTIEPDLPTPFMAPAVPDYLTGRESEIAMLVDLLTNADHKIMALVGMGGIGKTTLAAATAHQLKEQFPDGILWGSLLDSSAENVLKLWGQAFGRDYSTLPDLNSLAIAVRNTLANKRVLIVLDNVENEMTLEPFLQTGDGCRMLLTTRDKDAATAINAHSLDLEELSLDNSLHLMSQILNQTDVAESEQAQEICRLLDNLPLAIEITAQLLKARPSMTLDHMLERLKKAQNRLGLKIAGNRGIRPTFEVSWEILGETQQNLFASLGIFEGRSFTLEAAESLVEADPIDTVDNLHSLVALSLVKWDGSDERFKQHPLLADFAREKLENDRPTWDRLVDYYLNFAEANALNYEALQPEWDNLLATILHLPGLEGWEQILKFTDLLHDSWFRYGRFSDAHQIYPLAEMATQRLEDNAQLAQILIRWSKVGLEQSDYDTIWDRLNHAQELSLRLEDTNKLAFIYFLKGRVLLDQSEYKNAELLAIKSLELFREESDLFNIGKASELLGWILIESENRIHESEVMAKNALKVFQELVNPGAEASTLRLMTLLAFKQNNLSIAENYARKALNLAQKSQNPSEEVAGIYNMVAVNRILENSNAESLAFKGLLLAEHLGMSRWRGLFTYELAMLYFQTKQYQASINQCLKAIMIFESIKERLQYAYTTLVLGDNYRRMGNLTKCFSYWEEAKKIGIHLNHDILLKDIEQREFSIQNQPPPAPNPPPPIGPSSDQPRSN